MFRTRTGAPVRVFDSPSAMIVGQVPFTLCDVMILQGDATMDLAVARKVADGGSRTPLGLNHLVVARSGPAAPPVRSLQEVRADGPVALVDAPVADALGVLTHQALGGWPGADVRIIGVATGADASYLLGTGEAKLAVLYRTDVAADPGLSVVANLPDGTPAATYAAALSMSVNSPNARAFIDFLKTPAARDKLRADGLEIAP